MTAWSRAKWQTETLQTVLDPPLVLVSELATYKTGTSDALLDGNNGSGKTVAKKKSLLSERNLEQDQAYK